MKISVDGKEILELTETQKKVIQHDIDESIFIEDMERRIRWVLLHKYEQSFMRLKKDWEARLAQRYPSIPTDADQLAELIFSQDDYKNLQEI